MSLFPIIYLLSQHIKFLQFGFSFIIFISIDQKHQLSWRLSTFGGIVNSENRLVLFSVLNHWKSILCNKSQSLKGSLPICVTLDGMVISCMLLLTKASFPIVSSLEYLENSMVDKLKQKANEDSLIWVAWGGIMMFLILDFSKALLSIIRNSESSENWMDLITFCLQKDSLWIIVATYSWDS